MCIFDMAWILARLDLTCFLHNCLSSLPRKVMNRLRSYRFYSQSATEFATSTNAAAMRLNRHLLRGLEMGGAGAVAEGAARGYHAEASAIVKCLMHPTPKKWFAFRTPLLGPTTPCTRFKLCLSLWKVSSRSKSESRRTIP
jgi:hypothetical protein